MSTQLKPTIHQSRWIPMPSRQLDAVFEDTCVSYGAKSILVKNQKTNRYKLRKKSESYMNLGNAGQ